VTVVCHEDRVGFGIVSCPDLMPRVWDPEVLEEFMKQVALTASSP